LKTHEGRKKKVKRSSKISCDENTSRVGQNNGKKKAGGHKKPATVT